MDQQYDPYRQRNTIEGYREFIAKYPGNMYLETALDQIDNLEFAPYEKADYDCSLYGIRCTVSRQPACRDGQRPY